MDSVIRNILDIDQNTAKLVRETEARLAQNDEILQSLLESRETELKEEAKAESDARYEEIMKKTSEEVLAMKKHNEKQLEKMDLLYREKQDRLAESILLKLIEM